MLDKRRILSGFVNVKPSICVNLVCVYKAVYTVKYLPTDFILIHTGRCERFGFET